MADVVLLTGWREWTDYHEVCRFLDWLHRTRGISLLIHGDSGYDNARGTPVRGVDRLGGRWAHERGVQQAKIPANWTKHPKTAGTIRNGLMLDLFPQITVCAAMPGRSGTANQMRQAADRKIEIIAHEDVVHLLDTSLLV